MKRRSILVLPVWATAARAHSYKADGIAIGHAWALLAAMGVDGQAFMPLFNQGPKADALIAARGDICSSVELRKNARYDDPPEEQFELIPGKPLPMRPAARHLRLIGVKKPLLPGVRFPLVLDFLNAGEIEVNVIIEDKGGH